MDNNNILKKINRAAIKFLKSLNLETTYKVIIDEAIKLAGGEEGFILLKEGKELNMVYAYPESLYSLKLRNRGFSYRSYAERKAFVLHAQNFGRFHPEVVEMGIKSVVLIPLSHRKKSIGTMAIMSKKAEVKSFAQRLDILKLYGSMASLAIREAQSYYEVKQALDTREMFLSMAAHEFRTPLTTIGGYAQMLKLKITKESAEKRWVEEIYKEAKRLTRLVQELMDVNRIRAGQLQYRWRECNLTALMNEAIAAFKISHPEHQINFETKLNETESFIIGDDDKITQVLNNVLDNAAKFSPRKKKIVVELKSKNDNLIISVIDKGIGIAKKDLDKVFEGFYQATNTAKEGMGLGLYLSKQIIEKHKGDIKLKSRINQGTTVEIRFPRILIRK